MDSPDRYRAIPTHHQTGKEKSGKGGKGVSGTLQVRDRGRVFKLNKKAMETKWISVNDRLPELKKGREYEKKSDPVLCRHSDGHHEDCIYFNGNEIYGQPYWYYVQDGEYTESVTHWMPLPEPPEQ